MTDNNLSAATVARLDQHRAKVDAAVDTFIGVLRSGQAGDTSAEQYATLVSDLPPTDLDVPRLLRVADEALTQIAPRFDRIVATNNPTALREAQELVMAEFSRNHADLDFTRDELAAMIVLLMERLARHHLSGA